MTIVHAIINHLSEVSSEMGNLIHNPGGLPGLTDAEQSEVKWELMRLREAMADTMAALASTILNSDITQVQHEIHDYTRHHGAAPALEQ